MFIEPMLLEKREAPFDDGRYVFEPKIDGHRLILSFIDGQVRLYTHHKTEVTQQYPELHHVPVEPGCHVILDGEVARMDDSGWMFISRDIGRMARACEWKASRNYRISSIQRT